MDNIHAVCQAGVDVSYAKLKEPITRTPWPNLSFGQGVASHSCPFASHSCPFVRPRIPFCPCMYALVPHVLSLGCHHALSLGCLMCSPSGVTSALPRMYLTPSGICLSQSPESQHYVPQALPELQWGLYIYVPQALPELHWGAAARQLFSWRRCGTCRT